MKEKLPESLLKMEKLSNFIFFSNLKLILTLKQSQITAEKEALL